MGVGKNNSGLHGVGRNYSAKQRFEENNGAQHEVGRKFFAHWEVIVTLVAVENIDLERMSVSSYTGTHSLSPPLCCSYQGSVGQEITLPHRVSTELRTGNKCSSTWLLDCVEILLQTNGIQDWGWGKLQAAVQTHITCLFLYVYEPTVQFVSP